MVIQTEHEKMADTVAVDGRKLVIDEAYLRKGRTLRGTESALERDLRDYSTNDEVALVRPRDSALLGMYADVLATVCRHLAQVGSIQGSENGYTLQVSEYDEGRVRSILGTHNVTGNYSQGLRYEKKKA